MKKEFTDKELIRAFSVMISYMINSLDKFHEIEMGEIKNPIVTKEMAQNSKYTIRALLEPFLDEARFLQPGLKLYLDGLEKAIKEVEEKAYHELL